ncbi:hypothetical protein [Desertibaculum subflavum]|uniref:hypothetical protein n=1 Tax=Desertibaculum subflavum TaxID=2268458 RepID=UPI000E65FBCC
MSEALRLSVEDQHPARARSVRRFPATIGRFDEPESRRIIDDLVRWIEDRYRADLAQRPSKHVYIRALPPDVIAAIDRLRDSPAITGAILRRFAAGHALTPMKRTDEVYISHYNKDKGGDQGLFSRHYDGNLRFLPYGAVVRALIYLQSDATYRVVFHDSGVTQAFASYEFGLLDFHRELHWVEGTYNPGDRQRILLKCNYLVAPRSGGWLTRAVLAANGGVFAVVKAAMEYSKSPKTLPQHAVGLLCNLFRLLNNLHPLVPLAFVAALAVSVGRGLYRLLS